MAPQQGRPQAWQARPALGVPVAPQQAYMAPALGVPAFRPPYFAPPMMLFPRPQMGGASGGGFGQRVRDAVQQFRLFPQQLQQLAQQATRYQPDLFQHAMDMVHLAIHHQQAGRPPMVLTPRPQVPMPMPPAVGIPVALSRPAPAPKKRVDEPKVQTPQPQVQGAAQVLSAQAKSFDPASLSQQLGQLKLQMMQTLQDHLADMRQQIQALAADRPLMGAGAALAGASAGAVPHKVKQD
jgi:hypothetical protein